MTNESIQNRNDESKYIRRVVRRVRTHPGFFQDIAGLVLRYVDSGNRIPLFPSWDATRPTDAWRPKPFAAFPLNRSGRSDTSTPACNLHSASKGLPRPAGIYHGLPV